MAYFETIFNRIISNRELLAEEVFFCKSEIQVLKASFFQEANSICNNIEHSIKSVVQRKFNESKAYINDYAPDVDTILQETDEKITEELSELAEYLRLEISTNL